MARMAAGESIAEVARDLKLRGRLLNASGEPTLQRRALDHSAS